VPALGKSQFKKWETFYVDLFLAGITLVFISGI
jgi:hypothetical protein